METENKDLMKHFAAILRKRANDETTHIGVDQTILRYVTRRDLVEIINQMHQGKLPRHLDLAMLENQELLKLIKDDLFIISHIIQKWCEKMSVSQEVNENLVESDES